MDVEITVWAVNATTPPQSVAKLEQTSAASATDEATAVAERQMFDPALGQSVSARVVQRDSLEARQSVTGPAAITEDETTIIIPSSGRAVRQSDGCIDVIVGNSQATT